MKLSRNEPLKVVHIASGDLWAGAEVQLYTLLCSLKTLGNVEPSAVLMNDGELARRLRERGIAVTIVDESRLGALQILIELRRHLQSVRPAVVHTHRIKENILGNIANLLATRAPSVRTVHGAQEHPPRGLRQLHKHALIALDTWIGRHLQRGVIAVSKGLQAPLARQFGADKVVVIENGVDIDSVRAAVKPVDFRVDAPYSRHIGIVGRLQPVKRVDLFLESAARLVQIAPQTDWRFHIIGDGPLRSALEQQAAALGLEQRAIFHGHRSDIPACLAGLDALVMCSDHEGMPMTLLEAIAVGTPVLAHAVGGMLEILGDKCGGVLVTEHNANGYSAGLVELLAMPAHELVAAGAARLAERYSAQSNARAVRELYRAYSTR